jgi:hypothetical protein
VNAGRAAELAWQVRRYLADCRQYRGILSPSHHPREEFALKVIYHRGAGEAAVIRAEYRRIAGGEKASLARTG